MPPARDIDDVPGSSISHARELSSRYSLTRREKLRLRLRFLSLLGHIRRPVFAQVHMADLEALGHCLDKCLRAGGFQFRSEFYEDGSLAGAIQTITRVG